LQFNFCANAPGYFSARFRGKKFQWWAEKRQYLSRSQKSGIECYARDLERAITKAMILLDNFQFLV
jgi:hypothetical protein